MVKKTYLTAKTYKNLKAKKEKVVFEEKEKKPTKEKKSPSISRFIPERVKTWGFLEWGSILLCTALTLLLVGALFFVGQKAFAYQKLLLQRETIEKQRAYWEGIVQTYPDYKDAYIMLGITEFQLGDKSAARIAITKAREIDPNDKRAQELQDKFAGKK